MFGLLTTDGRRIFRQYGKFDMHAFARFLKTAVYKFGKICMILDNAPQHYARAVCQIVERVEGLTLRFPPAATPEISAIEAYWKELKRKVLDVSHTSLDMLRKAIARYTRYAKPNLHVETFLY